MFQGAKSRVQFRGPHFSSAQLSSAQLSSVQFSSAQLSSVQLSSVQFSSKFSSVQFSSVQVRGPHFSSVQFTSIYTFCFDIPGIATYAARGYLVWTSLPLVLFSFFDHYNYIPYHTFKVQFTDPCHGHTIPDSKECPRRPHILACDHIYWPVTTCTGL